MSANNAGRGPVPNFRGRLKAELKEKQPTCLLDPSCTTKCEKKIPADRGQSKCGLCKRRAGM